MANFKAIPKSVFVIAGFLISIIAIYYLTRVANFSEAWREATAVNILFPLLMVVLYLSTFPLRTLRWKLMWGTADLDFFKLQESLILGFASNNVLPARAGELVRVEHFSKWSNISRVTALASVLMEKVLDALTLVFFLALSSFAFVEQSGQNEKSITIAKITGLAAALAFCAVVVILVSKKFLSKRFASAEQNGIWRTLLAKVSRSLDFISLSRALLKVVLLSVGIWFIEGVVFVLGAHAFGLHLPFLIGFVCLCTVNFGILIPSSPGYVGVFQGAFLFGSSLLFADSSISLAASILIHSCQFFPTTLIGGFFLIRRFIRK